MSEEKDAATISREAQLGIVVDPGEARHGLSPQIQPSPGLPQRAGAVRHRERLEQMWPTLPFETQQQISAAWRDEAATVA
jgi:phospholipid/cholesterol/gamma-HCH transport system ATP-binding protein